MNKLKTHGLEDYVTFTFSTASSSRRLPVSRLLEGEIYLFNRSEPELRDYTVGLLWSEQSGLSLKPSLAYEQA